MQYQALEACIDDCLKLAIQKCGNLDEAQELCQDTMLAALAYLASGGEIQNTRAWLGSVLNRKFYDALRKKYKLPTVSMEDVAALSADDEPDAVADETEIVQRSPIFRACIAKSSLGIIFRARAFSTLQRR